MGQEGWKEKLRGRIGMSLFILIEGTERKSWGKGEGAKYEGIKRERYGRAARPVLLLVNVAALKPGLLLLVKETRGKACALLLFVRESGTEDSQTRAEAAGGWGHTGELRPGT